MFERESQKTSTYRFSIIVGLSPSIKRKIITEKRERESVCERENGGVISINKEKKNYREKRERGRERVCV